MGKKRKTGKESLFLSGHRACHGCGMALGVRHVLEATGKNVIVVSPTGCLETFTSPYGFSPWRVPWIHHLFENGASVASGVAAALKAQKREAVRVVAMGGDGATFDIGFGALSGMLERDDDVLYICFDNGAYMNTGGQRSGATPLCASTTTHPSGTRSMGKPQMKKDLPKIVADHNVAYVATASIAYLKDLKKKVRKSMQYRGARYIQVDTPCSSGWRFPSELTMEMGRLAVNCGLVPLFEMEEGDITGVRKIKKQIPVEDYLKEQKRFRHLFDTDKGPSVVAQLQSIADANIASFGLA